MRMLVLVYATTLLGQPDAATVMSQAAANVERAAEARKQYVYQQSVRSSLTRSSGQRERRERREYSVIPNETRTDKKLVSFQGEYRKGKQMLAYTEPGFRTKGGDIDGELIEELTLSGAAESEKQKKTLKNMRVTGSGTVQGDTLKVGSLTKSDKPFGGS
jgi:hypothetical protein